MDLGLPSETINRTPPLGLRLGDEVLFRHEYQVSLPPAVPRILEADFLPQGLLVEPGSARLAAEGFQNGLPSGVKGLKARARAWEALLRFPRRSLVAAQGRRPLILTDEFSNGFFHWVGDVLPKLVWLAGELHRFELLLPSYTKRFRYVEESLALWPALAWQTVETRTRTALKNALVVPALAPTGNYRPALMRTLGAAWRDKVRPLPPHRQVYVSRAKAPWRKIRNEDEVWSALRGRGFERVFLEDLSFSDQVKLAAETRFLVSNHGAGLTDMAFMVPGTRVLEIRLAEDRHNNCYYSLACALGLEYTYLSALSAEKRREAHVADLLVDVPSLLRTLEVGP